jgi:hypothetical protein
MTDRLAALVRRVAELRQAGLEACHCVEEFYLQRIHPLGRRKTLAFKSPGWPILAAILCPVTSLYFLLTLNATFSMI